MVRQTDKHLLKNSQQFENHSVGKPLDTPVQAINIPGNPPSGSVHIEAESRHDRWIEIADKVGLT